MQPDPRVPGGFGGLWYGVYPATVIDIDDPEGQGRVKVALPWAADTGDARFAAWARLATFMAGADRGAWFIPDVDDEVLVAFVAGDPRWPMVIGAVWNGRDAPPESLASGNPIKSLTSRNGVKLTMDDTDGAEVLRLETPGGHTITLDDGGRSIRIETGSGDTVTLDTSGIKVQTAAKVSVNASTVEISAGMVTVDAGMSKFSGVVKADTVITNAVVSASYTPGAGNIW
ncbi:MAG: type IV secretion protein Rhs [Myxococcales bacterium]|nr:type IV secretion protein Rhs [Myxococcales bacterium]